MLEFKELEYTALLELGERLTQEDQAEIVAMGMTTPIALTRTFETSVEGLLVYSNSLLIGAFGVSQSNDLVPCYRPWLVMSPEGRAFPRQLLFGGRRIVSLWLNSYGYLENYVDARHTRAVTWLKRLGFTLEPAAAAGPFRRQFHRFYMGDPDVR